MSEFEKKYGKYAIPNLTLILILSYVVGYVISLVNPYFLTFLTLDPCQILFHGQVWRLFTWLIIPPEGPGGFNLFTLIMLYFYYSIGTLMERTLGTYKYNVFLIRGMLFTIAAAFLSVLAVAGMALLTNAVPAGNLTAFLESRTFAQISSTMYGGGSWQFSTYFINISIFFAFAMCYPEMRVLLMFVIPVKVKWMGILDLILLLYQFVTGTYFEKFAVGAALVNIGVFYLGIKNLSHMKPKEVRRRMEYTRQVRKSSAVTKHKCAICGQTEESNPNLEFRFCSKCNGNYEYCQEHLFTHKHVQ